MLRRPPTALETLDLPPDPFVALAVAIERPGNLGAIARTACAAGADALLVADSRTDVFHRDGVVLGRRGRRARQRRQEIPTVWLEAASDQVAVPAHGPVDSLNVAVAAGVVLCEAARAR